MTVRTDGPPEHGSEAHALIFRAIAEGFERAALQLASDGQAHGISPTDVAGALIAVATRVAIVGAGGGATAAWLRQIADSIDTGTERSRAN